VIDYGRMPMLLAEGEREALALSHADRYLSIMSHWIYTPYNACRSITRWYSSPSCWIGLKR